MPFVLRIQTPEAASAQPTSHLSAPLAIDSLIDTLLSAAPLGTLAATPADQGSLQPERERQPNKMPPPRWLRFAVIHARTIVSQR